MDDTISKYFLTNSWFFFLIILFFNYQLKILKIYKKNF